MFISLHLLCRFTPIFKTSSGQRLLASRCLVMVPHAWESWFMGQCQLGRVKARRERLNLRLRSQVMWEMGQGKVSSVSNGQPEPVSQADWHLFEWRKGFRVAGDKTIEAGVAFTQVTVGRKSRPWQENTAQAEIMRSEPQDELLSLVWAIITVRRQCLLTRLGGAALVARVVFHV